MKWWVVAFWLVGLGIILAGEISKPKRAVIFCDVGQGDMAIISDGSWQMVIDTGRSDGKGRECWDRNVPWWDRKIEVVMITHDDADHSGGIGQLLAGIRAEKIVTDGSYKISRVTPEEWLTVEGGEVIRQGSLEVKILDNPKIRKSPTDSGLIAVARIGGENYWFMADADVETEEYLVWRKVIEEAKGKTGRNILKVAHHGSGAGTSQTLLEAIKPQETVVSVGKNNYGHPAGLVIGRLENYGGKVWRTDQGGDRKFRW